MTHHLKAICPTNQRELIPLVVLGFSRNSLEVSGTTKDRLTFVYTLNKALLVIKYLARLKQHSFSK